jgi:transposase-like protein
VFKFHPNRNQNGSSTRRRDANTQKVSQVRLNARYRRTIRAGGHFPTEQAAMKCLYLVTRS